MRLCTLSLLFAILASADTYTVTDVIDPNRPSFSFTCPNGAFCDESFQTAFNQPIITYGLLSQGTWPYPITSVDYGTDVSGNFLLLGMIDCSPGNYGGCATPVINSSDNEPIEVFWEQTPVDPATFQGGGAYGLPNAISIADTPEPATAGATAIALFSVLLLMRARRLSVHDRNVPQNGERYREIQQIQRSAKPGTGRSERSRTAGQSGTLRLANFFSNLPSGRRSGNRHLDRYRPLRVDPVMPGCPSPVRGPETSSFQRSSKNVDFWSLRS